MLQHKEHSSTSGEPLKVSTREDFSCHQNIYDRYKYQVIHRRKLDESFDVLPGIQQGCILSQMLFILELDSNM
jgi:hypothetical protein